MRSLKIKVVGDPSVGKTSLLARIYCENSSSDDDNRLDPTSVPPVLDSYLINTTIDQEVYVVTFWDTCTMRSSDDFDLSKVRPLEYGDTDVFLVCFDISCPNSFQNISTVWAPELKHYMAGTPLIVVGNKADLRSTGIQHLLSPSKGTELATRLETVYCENSARTGQGVQETIATALRRAVQKRKSERGKKRFKLFQNRKTTPTKLVDYDLEPPLLPHPGPDEVTITVLPSTYASDMRKLLTSYCHSDITLAYSTGTQLFKAHKVVLCMGSSFFRDLLVSHDHSVKDPKKCQGETLSQEVTKNDINVMRLDLTWEFQEAFAYVLDFLYTLEFRSNPETQQRVIKHVSELAELAALPELVECCENSLKKEDYANKNACENAKENKNTVAKELFVNKPLLADVTFVVEGTRVFGHKAVLMTRSDVLAAMLGGGFKESSTNEVHICDASASAFIAMLEYLYTDSLPTSPTDSRQLLVLSDKFCLPRLRSLCELSISQKLKTEMRQRMHLSNETCGDVIETLLLAQAHNATQLSKWCVFTIKTNFPDFESHEDLTLLKPKDKEDVTHQRWPPQSYFQQLEAYKKKVYRE